MATLKIECQYDGLASAKTGITTVKFKAPYSSIIDYIKLFSFVGIDIMIAAKDKDEAKFTKLGEGRLKSISVGKEGEARLHFYGESFDVTNIHTLMDKVIIIAIKEVVENE